MYINFLIKVIVVAYFLIFMPLTNVEYSTHKEGSPQNNTVTMTKEQELEFYLSKTKDIYGFSDREIYEINKPVFATWIAPSSYIAIFPLDDMGEWIVDERICLYFIGVVYYETYGEYGVNAHYVNKFMKEINELCANGVLLNSFVMKDLIVTLEFSNENKLVFDRYYVELENNLDKCPIIFDY